VPSRPGERPSYPDFVSASMLRAVQCSPRLIPDAPSADLAARARNRQLAIPGHFSAPVRVEDVEAIGQEHYLLRVRRADGSPAETVLTAADLEAALATAVARAPITDPRSLFRWVEAHRIQLAYAHDPLFAVSLSGVRGLPHQIEAVYRRLLPQPRLRFVLADDPGAGKTIMAGLLIKELKLRGVVDRVLVVVPAPLTAQWQDELLDRFDEEFVVVEAREVRWRLGGNPWQQHDRVITSLDFAKQDDVRPDLLRAEWDLVVIDEAHKCSAVTYGEEVKRTKRYLLAEELSRRTARLLLLTAPPTAATRTASGTSWPCSTRTSSPPPSWSGARSGSRTAPTSCAARRRTCATSGGASSSSSVTS